MASDTAASVPFLSSKLARWVAVSVLAVVWFLLYPPIRFVSLDEDGNVPPRGAVAEVFDVAEFVEQFWTGRLSEGMEGLVSVATLARAVSDDPAEAKETYGLRAEEGSAVYYFAAGEGSVVELKGRRAVIDVGGQLVNLLMAPPVFGNTVRDGTNLLQVNEFPGLEEFNAVSSALNQRVENEIMPQLKDLAVVGSRISFVGCAKAPSSVGEGPVLEFTPLRVGAPE